MKKATLIITSALIWTAVLLAFAMALQGTEAFRDIQALLIGGTVISMFAAVVFGKQTTAKSK